MIEGDGTHVLVARRQVDTPIAVRVSDRALHPQAVPNSIGIIDPSLIEVIEIASPVHDWPTLCHGDTPIAFPPSGPWVPFPMNRHSQVAKSAFKVSCCRTASLATRIIAFHLPPELVHRAGAEPGQFRRLADARSFGQLPPRPI